MTEKGITMYDMAADLAKYPILRSDGCLNVYTFQDMTALKAEECFHELEHRFKVKLVALDKELPQGRRCLIMTIACYKEYLEAQKLQKQLDDQMEYGSLIKRTIATLKEKNRIIEELQAQVANLQLSCSR